MNDGAPGALGLWMRRPAPVKVDGHDCDSDCDNGNPQAGRTDIGEKHGGTEQHQRDGNPVEVLHLGLVSLLLQACASVKRRTRGEGPSRAWRVIKPPLPDPGWRRCPVSWATAPKRDHPIASRAGSAERVVPSSPGQAPGHWLESSPDPDSRWRHQQWPY